MSWENISVTQLVLLVHTYFSVKPIQPSGVLFFSSSSGYLRTYPDDGHLHTSLDDGYLQMYPDGGCLCTCLDGYLRMDPPLTLPSPQIEV